MTKRGQAGVVTADLLVANTWTEVPTMSTLSAFPTTDPRGVKAVLIAADAGQWLKCRTANGAKYYGIRSSDDADVIYFVTRTSCSCFDGQRRECKHQLAVQLHCERIAAERATEDVFARFEQDDRPLPTPDLSRILGRPRRGVIPAAEIVRED